MRLYKFLLVWTIIYFVVLLGVAENDPITLTNKVLGAMLFAMLLAGIFSLWCVKLVLSLWDDGEKFSAFVLGGFGVWLAIALLTRLILSRTWPE